ncbi:MAG: tryptophan--tRNA ligase [bacterium]|jgi:tryptophanyl-tRNA synthetase
MENRRKRILTGDRPTGKLHLGHYVGTLQNRVKLQYEYETYILIADVQALTTHYENPGMLAQSVRDVALDYLAVGIDPNAATICVQSLIPEIAELTVFYGLVTNMNKLRHNPTTKSEAQQLGLITCDDLMTGFDQLTYGFFGYPVSQAADITFVNADLVPVGKDQKPHIELCRDIVKKFNGMFGTEITEPDALIGDAFLSALDGSAKMSKSLGNAIFLSDDSKTVKEQVMKGVTDPARIKSTDKGTPEICNIYKYHGVFSKDFVDEARDRCRAGTIGCVECKMELYKRLETLLEPFRARRKEYEARPAEVDEILIEGTRKARAEGAKTLAHVREKLGIAYFG